MIDYKKLGRVLDSSDTQKLDQLINVNIDGLISQYDEKFIKHGFVKVDNNKYNLKVICYIVLFSKYQPKVGVRRTINETTKRLNWIQQP